MIDVSKLRAQAQFDLCHKGPTQVPTMTLIELLNRLEEVEAKRDALAPQYAALLLAKEGLFEEVKELERKLRVECDRWRETAEELTAAERREQTLAAHVARLRGLGQLVREAATDLAHIGTEELFDRAEKWDAALNDEPTTSLARRDAEKRAEGGEYIANVIGGAHDRKLALMRVAELRRQAKEGQPS